MPIAIPFTITNSLTFSPDGVAAEVPRAIAASGSYGQKDDDQYSLSGAGSVSMTLKGPSKALQISVDASTTAAPINVRLNGGVEDIEISPGGSLQLHNPVPAAGITSLEIVYTTSNVVKVIALS